MRARHLLLAAISAALLACPAVAGAAEPREIVVGVFLPHAAFDDNAARSTYAERVARAVAEATGEGWTARGRAFARRTDLVAFLKAGRLDLLVADPLFQHGRPGRVLAHAVDDRGRPGTPDALYASPGTPDAGALRSATVSVVDAGDDDARFHAAAALRGELEPGRWFGRLRPAKDVEAALGAVKARAAAAAFAPLDHPAAEGLEPVLAGGARPLAVLVGGLDSDTPLPGEVERAAARVLVAGAGRGGGIASWRTGAGDVMARVGERRLDVTAAEPILAPPRRADVPLPALRLEAEGSLPAPDVRGVAVRPALPEEESP
ncbi:MAG: hypothetical protein ACQEXJ_01940 [Myxococcota bacterium]